MERAYCFLGCLLLAAGGPLAAAKRFHDVLGNERTSAHMREHNQLNGWSSDENDWNERLYPVWKRGDPRWEKSWRGGQVKAVLTSDSPALVGSNITFVVNLVFPRCQKEDADGNIVYEKNCTDGAGPSADPYVYNWTAWAEDADGGNGSSHSYGEFPDGRPFPHHHRRRHRHHHGGSKCGFVYVFHTLGQYYQKLGRSSASISINTTNVTLGPQVMEVAVYRRDGRAYAPVAEAKDVYLVTDQILVFVNMSQKNDRNASDETFLRDIPILFNVLIHDPSHFLSGSIISYRWNFGDNTGLYISNHRTLNHTYVFNGTFSVNLTVQAAVPGPCPSPTPRPPKPTPSLPPTGDGLLELREGLDEDCRIDRYGHFRAVLTIVEGILEASIVDVTEVLPPLPPPEDPLVDFLVACEGTMPTEVCTVVSDPSCQLAQNTVCSPAEAAAGAACLLTVRRAFRSPGTFCVNLTLGDDASLALASTLVSVRGRRPGSPARMAGGALAAGCVAALVAVIALVVHRKRKEYKPIDNSAGVRGKGLTVFLEHAKVKFLPGSREKDPLLKNQPGLLKASA
ncbi:transmembrane glycoprotein NMB [Pipistrellus kuhlii]|uniref:Transmembrane glycoprotein NMB n=1 Tax=Pipistrellus kuhlii TaxID=59472 RepID=A0A7J7TNE3_PIPKU|nr:transmembrane glycoprotein NMB [Pipistrellus kuhlii]KAF6302279.1 glycoprotein nmb [Pipistrellus kuhlii]